MTFPVKSIHLKAQIIALNYSMNSEFSKFNTSLARDFTCICVCVCVCVYVIL